MKMHSLSQPAITMQDRRLCCALQLRNAWRLRSSDCVCRSFPLRDHHYLTALQIWLLGCCPMAWTGICCLRRASKICIRPPGPSSLLDPACSAHHCIPKPVVCMAVANHQTQMHKQFSSDARQAPFVLVPARKNVQIYFHDWLHGHFSNHHQQMTKRCPVLG